MTPKSIRGMAVMNVDKEEEIVGEWASAHILQVGVYKLLAKKRTDGVIEWAHFVQRDNGLKEKVYRGEVENRERLDEVMEIMNGQLKRVFGMTVKAADNDMYLPGGKDTTSTKK